MQLTDEGGTLKDLLAIVAITLIVFLVATGLIIAVVWFVFGKFWGQVAIIGGALVFVLLIVEFADWRAERRRRNEARSYRAAMATMNQMFADVAGTHVDIVSSDDERDAKQFQATAKMVLELLRVVKEQEKQQLERVKTDEHAARTENRYRIAEDARQRKELEASAIDGEFYGALPQVTQYQLPEID